MFWMLKFAYISQSSDFEINFFYCFLTYLLIYVLKLTYKLCCPKKTGETYDSKEFLFFYILFSIYKTSY